MDLTFSTLMLESFLLVMVRVGTYCAIAPLLGHKAVNARMRVLIAFFLSLIVFTSMEIPIPIYETVFDYSFLVIKEAIVGLSLGFVANLAMSVLVMGGELIDREVGFSMATNFDASLGTQVTITSELYDRLVYAIMLVNHLHYYIIRAIMQSFVLVPMYSANISYGSLYETVIEFIGTYFSIGIRLSLPVFLSATILNVVLGILAKSSPQMNMFSIGMQLKVLSGLVVLSLAIMFVPNITTFLLERMNDMLSSLMGGI